MLTHRYTITVPVKSVAWPDIPTNGISIRGNTVEGADVFLDSKRVGTILKVEDGDWLVHVEHIDPETLREHLSPDETVSQG